MREHLDAGGPSPRTVVRGGPATSHVLAATSRKNRRFRGVEIRPEPRPCIGEMDGQLGASRGWCALVQVSASAVALPILCHRNPGVGRQGSAFEVAFVGVWRRIEGNGTGLRMRREVRGGLAAKGLLVLRSSSAGKLSAGNDPRPRDPDRGSGDRFPLRGLDSDRRRHA